MDSGTPTSMAWQILPYAILTLGEVLVSATGVEFAYSQAPASMKGTIMSLWYLAVTVGSLWVLIVNSSVKNDAVLGYISHSGIGVIAFQMYFFAVFAAAAALIFAWYATRYRMTNHYRD
jgi:POT family proton-dependent oligopeptide transporter